MSAHFIRKPLWPSHQQAKLLASVAVWRISANSVSSFWKGCIMGELVSIFRGNITNISNFGAMKLPHNSHIPKEKLTAYLLQRREENDKSNFLGMGGYFLDNWDDLREDINRLLELEAELAQLNEFGQFFEITGRLRNLGVKTIWLLENGTETPRFITLFPFP